MNKSSRMTDWQWFLLFSGCLFLGRVWYMFIYRPDASFEHDSFEHLLQVFTVFQNFPEHVEIGLSVWAKPLYTYVYGLIALLPGTQNLASFQLFSSLIISLISAMTFSMLRRLGIGRSFALFGIILLQITYSISRSSLNVLTEPIFTLTVFGSFYFLCQGRLKFSAVLVGMSVLGRMEGFLYVFLWGFFLFQEADRRKIWGLIILTLLPAGIWNFLGYLSTGEPLYLLRFGYPSVRGIYGYGSISHYLMGLARFDPVLVFFAAFSIPALKHWHNRAQFQLIRRCQLIALCTWAAHTVIYALGAQGSAGLMRFLVPMFPFLTICAVIGAQYFVDQRRFSKAPLIAFLAGVLLFQGEITRFSLRRNQDIMLARTKPEKKRSYAEAGEWIRSNSKPHEFVFSEVPAILYYGGRDLTYAVRGDKFEWTDQRFKLVALQREWCPTTIRNLVATYRSVRFIDKEICLYQLKN